MLNPVQASSDADSLSGLRVLDISRFIAGPYAGQVLGHLGADVVKIESPDGGDPMRHLSKYSNKSGSAHFLSGNASKRSLAIDLKRPEGRDVFLDLVKGADIVIENFRPGVLERLGIGHARLQEVNSRLIIGSITGFGQTGPWKDWAAYDLIAQAVGGGMSLTGWPGEKAVKMGVPIGDVGASIYLVIGILAALNKRHKTGEGDVVDVSMMDVQLSLLGYHAHYFWMSGEEPQPEGDSHPNVTPYQSFVTRSRPLVVAVYGDPFWPGFCRAIDRMDLFADTRFATNTARMQNKAALDDELMAVFAGQPREYWLPRLLEEGVPAAPLNSVGEAVSSEQALARDMTVKRKSPSGETIELLGSPIKFKDHAAVVQVPPALGADTEAVLSEWGHLTPEQIDVLREAGVILSGSEQR